MNAGPWFYASPEGRHGPFILDQLISRIAASATEPHAVLVWCQGLPQWLPAGTIPEIATRLPPPLPMPHRARAAPRHTRQPRPTRV